MENTILGNINKCGAGAVGVMEAYDEFQLNSDMHVQNDIWFKQKRDFSIVEKGAVISGTTEDNTASGLARESVEVVSFNETESITITESNSSAFLQLIHQVQLQSDDFIRDFMSCGINVRRTVIFGNGAKTIQTYKGAAVPSFDKVFSKLPGPEAEFAMDIQFNYEPENVTVGFTHKLPGSFTEVTADVSVAKEASDMTVLVSNVQDPDLLVMPTSPTGKEWRVEVIDPTDGSIVASQYAEPATPCVFTGLTTGDYIVATSYHYFMDVSMDYYRYIDVKEFTL